MYSLLYTFSFIRIWIKFEGVAVFLISKLAEAGHIVILNIVAWCGRCKRSVFDIRGNFEAL